MIVITSILVLIAGLAKGLRDRLLFHYKTIPNSFNRYFWDPELSWFRKYKDNNPMAGPRFIGSTTFLVWLTDGLHLMNFICYNTLILAACFYQPLTEYYVLDFIILRTLFGIGFKIMYK